MAKNNKTTPAAAGGGTKREFPVYWVLLIFLVTTLIFFRGNLFGSYYFWEDIVEYVYPVQSFAATESGIPFWTPYVFSGMPFMADLQTGYFYPFNRLLDLFVSDGRLPFMALQIIIILHFFISQVAMYFYSRSVKISVAGSVLAAVCYTFSSVLVCHVIHPMMIYHLAWFPLILMLTHKAIKESSLRNAALAGLLYGMTLLAGHPQTTLYTGLFLGLYSLWQLGTMLKAEERKITAVSVIAPAAVIIIAAGMFCIQYLPSARLAELSQRAESSYKLSTEGSLQGKQVFTAVVPGTFGSTSGKIARNPTFFLTFDGKGQIHFYWETYFYMGLAALMLGFFALLADPKDNMVRLMAGLAIFGLLFALGKNFFLYDLFYNLPFFGAFRNPGRILFFCAFGISVLAGFGLDRLGRAEKKDRIKLIVSFAALFLMAVIVSTGVFSPAQLPPEIADSISSNAILSMVFLALIFGAAFALQRKILAPVAGGAVLIILAFIDLNAANSDFNSNPQNPDELYTLMPDMKTEFAEPSPSDIFRVNMRLYNPPYLAMQRNQGLTDRIMLIEGYNPLMLERLQPPLEKDMLHDVLAVKYEIGIDMKAQAPRFYERTTRLPHARMVYDAVVVDKDKVAAEIKSGEHDLRTRVLLEKAPAVRPQKPADPAYAAKVRCTAYESDEMAFHVKSDYDGILVLSEIYYPDWKAYVNGRETEILRADYSLRGIPLKAGTNKVELRYESPEFATGWKICVATIAAAMLLYVFGGKRKKASA